MTKHKLITVIIDFGAAGDIGMMAQHVKTLCPKSDNLSSIPRRIDLTH